MNILHVLVGVNGLKKASNKPLSVFFMNEIIV